MAEFVVHLHMRPSDYWALTKGERDAIVQALNRKARRR